jgi:RNA polymerase sigma factor (sigma-70 family)
MAGSIGGVSADAAPSADAPASTGKAERAQRLARCLERAREGDRAALDEAVVELNPLLWHVARAQGLTAEDAADVVQTTWLELVRRLHDIRSPEALTAWLVSTTRREAWRTDRRVRRRSGQSVEVLESIPDPGPELEERLDAEDRQRVLVRHFRRLPERCRALLRIIALVERPDYTTIAEALGMPRGSIGPTRGRCLAKLREMLLADPAWTWSTP